MIQLAGSLRRCGVDARFDRAASDQANWTVWMTEQVEEADFVLCVLTDLYLERWNQDRPAGGVEFEARLLKNLAARDEHRALPLFLPPVPADFRTRIPLDLGNSAHALASVRFQREHIPEDAMGLLSVLYREPAMELPPLAPPMTIAELRASGEPAEKVVPNESRAELMYAMQIDRERQWQKVVDHTPEPWLLFVLYGARNNAVSAFSQRMAGELRRYFRKPFLHRDVPMPTSGRLSWPRQAADWRRAVQRSLPLGHAPLPVALEDATRDPHLSLFLGPIPEEAFEEAEVREAFQSFFDEDLAPALSGLAEEPKPRSVWVTLCLETKEELAELTPEFRALARAFGQKSGMKVVILPEIQLPSWTQDIEPFLEAKGANPARWGEAKKLYKRVRSGDAYLETLFEKLDELADDRDDQDPNPIS